MAPARDAMCFLCDDVLVAIGGKNTIIGMFTSDIIIPREGISVSQLVVMFQIRTPVDKPFTKLILQVSMPGEEAPRQIDITPGLSNPPVPEGRTMRYFKLPFLIGGNPVLHSGAIVAKVIHEDGEILAGKHWITTLEQAQAFMKKIASA